MNFKLAKKKEKKEKNSKLEISFATLDRNKVASLLGYMEKINGGGEISISPNLQLHPLRLCQQFSHREGIDKCKCLSS